MTEAEPAAEAIEQEQERLGSTGENGEGRRRFPVRHASWVLTVFVVAIVTRSLWVWYAPADPTTKYPPDDTYFYHYYAVEVMEGHGYVIPGTDSATAFWPPGYSFMLAGLYRVFGAEAEVAWAANVVLGALTCVALYVLGYLVAGRRVGAVSGLLLAVYPGHVFYASLVLSETLFTLVLVVAICTGVMAARAASLRWVVATGVALGLACLVRGQAFFVVPAIALFWLISTGKWRRTVMWTAVVVAATVATISPWTVRNYLTMDGFVFISTNDGHNLYMGNYGEADGRVRLGADAWIHDKYADLSRQEREIETNRYAMKQGLEYMWGHPGHELELVGLKLRALYADDQEALRGIADEASGEFVPNSDLLGDVANGAYFAVLGLAALGAARWFLRPRSALGIAVFAVVFLTAGQLLFFADPRFHFPMMPGFVVLAACAVVGGGETLLRIRRKGFASSSPGIAVQRH